MLDRTIALDNRIRVAAIFQNGTVKPVWFDLEGKRYDVKELCCSWDSREGAASILHYSVWDGKNTYELTYNTLKSIWSMGAVAQRR